MTYQEAKLAVELFESEYLGQDQTTLWEWACDQACEKPKNKFYPNMITLNDKGEAEVL